MSDDISHIGVAPLRGTFLSPAQTAWIADARALIAFVEQHPRLPTLPALSINCYDVGAETKENLADIAKQLGTFNKSTTGFLFTIKRMFGAASLSFIFLRDSVCVKRIVGTKTVEKEIYPAAVTSSIEMVEEEIVEWDCPSLLREDEPEEPHDPPTEDFGPASSPPGPDDDILF